MLSGRRRFLRTALLAAATPALGRAEWRGRSMEGRFHSPALGEERGFAIHLPPFRGTSDAELPVLYFLHGLRDDHGFWSDRGLADLTYALWEDAAIPPMAIALVDGKRGFYTNAYAGGPREEDLVFPDFVRFAEARLLGPRPRGRRAIAGISMGGYGALKIALKNPASFVAAASLSGSLTAPDDFFDDGGRLDGLFRRIFGPPADPGMREQADVYRVLERLHGSPAPDVFLACGLDDRYGFHAGARSMAAALARCAVPATLVLEEGGHDFGYWTRAMPRLLAFVGARFQAER